MMTLLLITTWLSLARSMAAPDVRLYALDCGHATFSDMGQFSDTGEYDGKPGEVADPCFVIRHPQGVLLWDTGLGDKFAANIAGVDLAPGVHLTGPITLVAQLKSLGLTPKDVGYVVFSHLHWDHTGNANDGHQVLEVKLKKSGTIFLSGDLYHLRANREFMRVPAGNSGRAKTLASMNRIETRVKNTEARLVVQHDPQDFQALPKLPAFLD